MPLSKRERKAPFETTLMEEDQGITDQSAAVVVRIDGVVKTIEDLLDPCINGC